jgi:TPR repeat protein
MARTTELTPYDEQIYEALDEEQSISASLAYRSAHPIATSGRLPAEDSMPLFLSNDIEQYGRRGFGEGRERSTISSIILKLSAMTAVAAAAAFAIMTVGNPLPLFTNAKASLLGVSVGQSDAARPNSAQSSAVQPALAVQPAVDVAQAATTTPNAPTREEMAKAFIAARQNQTEVRPPIVAAAPAAIAVAATPNQLPTSQLPATQLPPRQLDADELGTLLKRARALVAIGDIASARLLLERAADAQQADAALLLAQTYDPSVLGTPDMRSITPDPAAARDWYQKAAQLGSRDAQARLAQMQN